jgi:hypothetical protein
MGALGDLVRVVSGGQPGSQIEELAYAGFGDVVHTPGQVGAVRLGQVDGSGIGLFYYRHGLPVDLEVILAAEHRVVYSCDRGRAHVDLGREVRGVAGAVLHEIVVGHMVSHQVEKRHPLGRKDFRS